LTIDEGVQREKLRRELARWCVAGLNMLKKIAEEDSGLHASRQRLDEFFRLHIRHPLIVFVMEDEQVGSEGTDVTGRAEKSQCSYLAG